MQIFHHSTNTIAKVSIFGGVFLVAASLWVLAEINRSSYNTGQYIEVQGSGEEATFSHRQLERLLELGRNGVTAITALQRKALGATWPLP